MPSARIADSCRDTLRAGLLHDIGKLGVSNRILDKPSKLTDEEFGQIRNHPRWTWEILKRVSAFNGFARQAAQRVLAVADVYEALTADRPYRAGMAVPTVLDIMRRDQGTAFDSHVFDAAAALAERGTFKALAEGHSDPFPQLRQEPAKFTRIASVA